MLPLLKISDSKKMHVETAWWMHIIERIYGDVMIVGRVDHDTLDYLSKYCNVYCLNYDIDKNITHENITCLTLEECKVYKFNSIIINSYNVNPGVEDIHLNILVNQCLHANGYVCFMENNEFMLKYGSVNLMLKILNVFRDIRFHQIKNICQNRQVMKLSTMSDNAEPYESFSEGRYSSNKNIFQLKEKIRSIILNSSLSRLFVTTNMWIIGNKDATGFLHQSLIREILKVRSIDVTSYQLGNIIYKRGKLIFSYKDIHSDDKSIFAMILYDEESCKQRLNEEKIISYLQSQKILRQYLPSNYYKFDYYGFVVFTMQEFVGIVVGLNSKHLKEMTYNISDVLTKLSSMTKKSIASRSEPEIWLNKLEKSIPGCEEEIQQLSCFIAENDFPLSVCMHGDAKIENFVLNKSSYQVEGIIDWEQASIDGYPLIDIYYLLIYNYQFKYECDFSVAYFALCNNEIEDYEKIIIDSYCDELSLNNNEKTYLLILFFIHHYSCRYHIDPDVEHTFNDYKSAIITAVSLLKRNS